MFGCACRCRRAVFGRAARLQDSRFFAQSSVDCRAHPHFFSLFFKKTAKTCDFSRFLRKKAKIHLTFDSFRGLLYTSIVGRCGCTFPLPASSSVFRRCDLNLIGTSVPQEMQNKNLAANARIAKSLDNSAQRWYHLVPSQVGFVTCRSGKAALGPIEARE